MSNYFDIVNIDASSILSKSLRATLRWGGVPTSCMDSGTATYCTRWRRDRVTATYNLRGEGGATILTSTWASTLACCNLLRLGEVVGLGLGGGSFVEGCDKARTIFNKIAP